MNILDLFARSTAERRDNHKKVPCFYVGEVPPELEANYDYKIQQVRYEIKTLIEVLLKLPKKNTVLELGCGNHGGTHFLWRLIFNKVITVESLKELVERIDYPIDERSNFIIGATGDKQSINKVKEILGDNLVDFLFIDAGHDYHYIKEDRENYKKFVREGGIIAYHDSFQENTPTMGVKQFVDELRNAVEIFDILDKTNLPHIGISYEINH